MIHAANIGEFGLAAELRPRLVDRFGRRMDEIHSAPLAMSRVTLRFGVPDLLHLEEPTVSSTDVVLPELERGAPSGAFEFATVTLL